MTTKPLVDKNFCMSSYLIYRYNFDPLKCFDLRFPCNIADMNFERSAVTSADELICTLERYVEEMLKDNHAALALSGGIDSAILARFMPRGSMAYTFRCIVPGVRVIDESEKASHWATENGLNHEIIEITWQDVEGVVDGLMKNKGGPIHSIEAQIYLAALRARKDGYTKFIFGENADIIYGGMDGLLKKDWHFGEFVDRYMYVNPYYVLRNSEMILEPFKEFEKDGFIDAHGFVNKYFRQEALGTYNNACQAAGIEFGGPYALTYLNVPLDLKKIRSGNSKYIVREAFKKLYPDEEIPQKIPMPRPVNEWFAGWSGPKREEFFPHCTDEMTGDQKWMIWCLERFLNNLEKDVYEYE